MERKELLVQRVKNSLNMQSYTMNDSWLLECIEFYLEDHLNPELEEVSNFVINQWLLSDLREVNNENGCLPRNLANQKRTLLPGKYILQMDKIYDISMSKYKQLEKIRNVSSENVEATENENVNQEDKFQAWEPKSKRMLQLSLTDGVQDILAIEYKPIRFLKDTLYPGYKLMIRGPVECRKGVILLEESNIKEMGGEVDSLLITNAVENIFARALNLEENPDPYNDNNQQNCDSQNTQNTLDSKIDDDFDLDSEMIEQIDKQIQEQNPISTQNSTSTRIHDQRQSSCNAMNNLQKQSSLSSNRIQNSIVPITSNNRVNTKTKTSMNENKTPMYENISEVSKFEDDDADSYLDTIDETSLNYSLPKSSSLIQSKYGSTSKQSSSPRILQCSQEEEFPLENEIHDLTDEHSPFFNSEKVQSKPSKKGCIVPSAPPSYITDSNDRKNCKREKQVQTNTSKRISSDPNNRKTTFELPSPLKTHLSSRSRNNDFEFPDDDDLNELNLDANDFKDSFGNDHENDANLKFTRSPSTTLSKFSNSKTDEKSYSSYANKKSTNISNEFINETRNSLKNVESEIDDELNIEFESKMEMDYKPFELKINRSQESTIEGLSKNSTIKSQFGISKSNFTVETTGVKRLASERSPNTDAPQKVRCLQNTPKLDKAADRKITEFLSKNLLNTNTLKINEFISEVLERPVTYEGHRALVRGKVVNVVKLNLLKNENGPYFHLEGRITDGTASTDVVFSSEVLENIIGYSPQEFTLKRKQCKVDSSMKDQLREDLLKAQQTLKYMDVLMELVIKSGHKPLIVNTCKLTQKEIDDLDKKAKKFKKSSAQF